jgi:hypothetical protein
VQDLPAGTVTFLFTDIEGSTALLKQLGHFFSARTGCQIFQSAYGFMDLGALCLRR